MTNSKAHSAEYNDWKIGDYFLYYRHETNSKFIFKIDGSYEDEGNTYYKLTDCISGDKAIWFWKYVYSDAAMITEEEAMRYILEA